MEIAIFAKKRQTREGKHFYSYITVLTRKDGTDQAMSVKFRESCPLPKPENCPMYINVERGNANIATRDYTREDTGEKVTSYTLWVNDWTPGREYEDHSLDEFDI